MVGKESDMIPSILQACLDMNNLSVESVKYTSCLVVYFDPEGDVPVNLNGKAPSIVIMLLLAAVICI